jgi:hypothetical protein
MHSIKSIVGAVLASSLLLGGGLAAAAPAVASHGSGADNSPPFDFSDAFYRTNGIDPAGLVGRRSGADGLSVPATAPDGNHRNVRVTFTLPAYDTSGNEHFFTVLADLAPTAFTSNQAGVRAKQIADASPVYVFPTRTGDPLSVGNNRQADMIDMSNGYFSNNPLGLWVHVFVTWTSKAFDTATGRKALADLAARNGLALDGTPIIKSKSQLDSLTKDGLVVQTKRAPGTTGRYFVCPVIKEPRNGGIAPDAFLATVRRADGTPLPAEQQFVTDFESLRTTGDYPR